MDCCSCIFAKKKKIINYSSQIKIKDPNERIVKNSNIDRDSRERYRNNNNNNNNINFINININQNINGLNIDTKLLYGER